MTESLQGRVYFLYKYITLFLKRRSFTRETVRRVYYESYSFLISINRYVGSANDYD